MERRICSAENSAPRSRSDCSAWSMVCRSFTIRCSELAIGSVNARTCSSIERCSEAENRRMPRSAAERVMACPDLLASWLRASISVFQSSVLVELLSRLSALTS